MQKANWREANPQISMGTNNESCNAQTEQYLAREMLCMMISLAASSQAKVVFYCPSFSVFAFHCYRASTNIRLYAQKNLRRSLPLRRLNPALIHPSAVPQSHTQGPPCSPHHPHPGLWHNAVVAFRAFMLPVVWGRLKTLCVRQPLSWVAGRNLLGCEWRDRNAHMNGLVCAGHLLTEGRYASTGLSSSE